MKKVFFALVIWLSSLTLTFAEDVNQDSLLLSRQENFERFSRLFPTERVYVHFDNTSYYKGENIWFNAYVVRDDNLHHTDISRILYVELLNPIGYPVETQKLIIENGQAHGSFELKDTLNAGFYEVRAYTQWMLNFTTGDPHGWRRLHSNQARRQWGERVLRYMQGNAGVFSRVFPIYEPVDSGNYYQRRIPQLAKATSSTIDREKNRLKIDFYPEGGNMIRDVEGRIAYQAHDSEGRTLNVEGQLVRRGKVIGRFKSDYAGRGVFSVTPDSLDSEELMKGLELKVNYAGKDYSFPLPKPKRRGYSLCVFSNNEQMKTIVARNAKTPGQQLGLSVTSRGHTYYYDVVDLENDLSAVMMIDKHSLQTGVNVVSLFTSDGKVLAQRLVFVNNHDMDGYKLQQTLSTWQADSLEPYQKMILDYQLVDSKGQPVRAEHDFSIAVTDDISREETYDDNTVLTYLLLSSEVKGFIPHPGYYFESDDAEHRGALDQLMMVQGWTRYDYEQMMSGSDYEPLLAVERGLTFAARVWDDNDYHAKKHWKLQANKPYWVYSELYIEGDTVARDHSLDSFIQPKMIILDCEAKIDSAGTFRFNMEPFYGKGQMALMLNKNSIEEIGPTKGGVIGHNFRWNTIKRPLFMIGKRMEPLNQYSPLPKNYDYYETAALTDPIDRDIFRYGYMAVNTKEAEQRIAYDNKSRTYTLPNIQKTANRRWIELSKATPASVMNVKDMMTWLCNIFGDIQDFKFRTNTTYQHTYGEINDDFARRMMSEDYAWMLDELQKDASAGRMIHPNESNPAVDQWIPHVTHELEDRPYFAHLSEMLYIFGLDGMNDVYVDANVDGTIPHFTSAVAGSQSLLPNGLRMFPVNENFKELQLFADTDNRQLTHQPGRYHEGIFPTGNFYMPVTSVFNFITDSVYSNTHPLPDFMGFRINFQGFTQPAEFYHPDYDWEPEPEDTDYRRTVYWNPQVKTDADGRAHIEFYNNGFSRRLAVSAEGITANGQPIMNGK